ncbi:34792_t:CDS:2, partial [Racocetra persica]
MYPGQQYSQQNQQQQSQNQQYPGGFVLPSNQQQQYYPPHGGYPPTSEPPGQLPPGGYAPPSGPPPSGYTLPPGPPPGGYAPPSSTSDSYAPPPSQPTGNYVSPPGPPLGPPQVPPSGVYPPPPGPLTGGYAPPPQNQQFQNQQFQNQQFQNQQFQNQQFQNQQFQGGYMVPPQSVRYNNGGHKKALLIGINYFKQQGELRGCINDVANVKRFLIESYGFQESDMVILTDDQQDQTKIPYKANILEAMKWLVRDARPGDIGHGGQVKDVDGDEEDGFDETIVPVDYSQNGQIIDDEMHEIMVKPLQEGVRLFGIFDSCHSGSALDLPYTYSSRGLIKAPKSITEDKGQLMKMGMSLLKGNKKQLLSFAKNNASSLMRTGKNYMNKSSKADVITLSGCKDEQTSADAYEEGRNTGAMSYAFIKAMGETRDITYQQLLNNVRDILVSKQYTQKPQISS